MQKYPIFYNRSSIIILDDDIVLMRALTHLFDVRHKIEAFSDPVKCLAFYKDKYKENVLNKLIEINDDGSSTDSEVNIDLSKIIMITNQFIHEDNIGVIIVDYHMPKMDGISFCRALIDYPVKKILLTGAASVDIAINALNEGVIDCYLTKGDQNMASNLEKYVAKLEMEYYKVLTMPLMSCLDVSNQLPLSDCIFTNKLEEIMSKNSITSYVLIDKNGTLLLRDNNARTFFLVVHTDRSLYEFSKLNDDVTEARSYIDLIQNREKIPFFGIGKECWEYKVCNWNDYFYPTEVLYGKQKYFLSFFENIVS